MKKKDLWNNRIAPSYNEMYINSKHFLPIDHQFTWADMVKYSDLNDQYKMIPFMGFFLEREKYLTISNKAGKGLRGFWKWPWRSEIIYTQDEINEMQNKLLKLDPDGVEYKDLADKIEYNDVHIEHERLWKEYISVKEPLDQQMNEKKISRKDYNKKLKELAKKYNMSWSVPEAEQIRMTLALGCSPCICLEAVQQVYKDTFELGELPGEDLSYQETLQWYADHKVKHPTDSASLYRFWVNFSKDHK